MRKPVKGIRTSLDLICHTAGVEETTKCISSGICWMLRLVYPSKSCTPLGMYSDPFISSSRAKTPPGRGGRSSILMFKRVSARRTPKFSPRLQTSSHNDGWEMINIPRVLCRDQLQ